jgi:DNA repair photolyase
MENEIPENATSKPHGLGDRQALSCTIIRPAGWRHKSLSTHAANFTLGCGHGCKFCYVPAITRSRSAILTKAGISDADASWGSYGFVRPWDDDEFRRSLATAEAYLGPWDGHRAIFLSSTSDAYQSIELDSPAVSWRENERLRSSVTRALELIASESTMRVRVLTRSDAVLVDLPLFSRLAQQNRVLVGMSLPTVNDDLAAIYEPHAPPPSRRLATLQTLHAAGIPVYIAMAPVYPELGPSDVEAVLEAVRGLNPWTVFSEPINVRGGNVGRIESAFREDQRIRKAMETGWPFAGVFQDQWAAAAVQQLKLVEQIGAASGMPIHLWPDEALDSELAWQVAVAVLGEDMVGTWSSYRQWLRRCWAKVSDWPGEPRGRVLHIL